MANLWPILTLVVGLVGGFITAQYWGKPAKNWKKLEKYGLEVYQAAQKILDKAKG